MKPVHLKMHIRGSQNWLLCLVLLVMVCSKLKKAHLFYCFTAIGQIPRGES